MRLHLKRRRSSRTVLALVGAASLLLPASAAAADAPEPPAAERLGDNEITRAIETNFIADRAVPFDEIDVVTREGIVTLTGEVDDLLARDRALKIAESVKGVRAVVAYEKQRAREIAAALNGVTSVADELRVDDNWTWRTDREIRRNIEDELFWSPFVDEDDVTVLVENGVAILEGTVDDWSEAVAAIENAEEGGARRVQSRLAIESLGSL